MATTRYGTRVGVESTVAKRTGRRTVSVRLPSLAVALAVLALVLAPGALATNAAGRPAPQLADPSGTAKRLVNRYFVLVADKDRAGLRRFLSPGFQVQRADGSGAAKRDYLANLPTIERFQITRRRVTRAGGTLVVRYRAEVEGVLDGRRFTPGPAPRLSVFAWNGKRWQLAAHANFNPITG